MGSAQSCNQLVVEGETLYVGLQASHQQIPTATRLSSLGPPWSDPPLFQPMQQHRFPTLVLSLFSIGLQTTSPVANPSCWHPLVFPAQSMACFSPKPLALQGGVIRPP